MATNQAQKGGNGTEGGRTRARGARCIALIGPFASGKTTLLEAILSRTGTISRPGSIAAKNTVGDGSPEARDHGMSVQLNVAEVKFLDDTFTFIDCPGSVEFLHEGSLALAACDAAVVVCEPDPRRVPALQIILKRLEDMGLPHLLFLNKIDTTSTHVREIIPALQPASAKPLVLRQIPIWENGIATGYVDLASERAYVYREHAESQIIELPKALADREKEARFQMLEKLADYDDELMEQLLSDMPPPKDKVFGDLTQELRDGLIVPVLLGSAEHGNGILRLLKALRHEAPGVTDTARRLKIENAKSAVYIFKNVHTKAGGKLSFARVLTGEVPDSATLTGRDGREERVAGIFSIKGEETVKRGAAHAGDVVALGRLEHAAAGETMTSEKGGIVQIKVPPAPQGVFAVGLASRIARMKSNYLRRWPSCWKKTPRSVSITPPTRIKSCSTGKERCTCVWRLSGWRASTASRCCASRAVSPTRRPSRVSRKFTPATRSNRVAMVSSATSSWRSGRYRAVRASCSTSASRGALFRATSSRRSRSACATISSMDLSASRWSTSASR